MTVESNSARAEPTLQTDRSAPTAAPIDLSGNVPVAARPAHWNWMRGWSADWLKYVVPVLASSLVTLAVISPLLYTVISHRVPPVATVDLQKLVESAQARQLAALRASSTTHSAQAAPGASDAQAAVDESGRFARDLSVAVDLLGQSCHCVLVNKAAILL